MMWGSNDSGGGAGRSGRLVLAARARVAQFMDSTGHRIAGPPQDAEEDPQRVHPSMFGLSARLLLLTAVFVMLAEVLIFLPSIANFRVNWLTDRLTAARLASLAADAVPEHDVPAAVRLELLSTAKVRSVAIKQNDMRRLVLPPDGPLAVDYSYDLRRRDDPALLRRMANWVSLIADALAVFFAPPDRTILVFGHPYAPPDSSLNMNDFVEIVLQEAPLRQAMVAFALNILGLSIMISIIAAALVYFALNRLLVQPMMRITHSMVSFSRDPENASLIITPSRRTDEVGIAERQLARMQLELRSLLNQKNHLAQLGLAVSKINHDLRNMLASTQLLSDRLGSLKDPAVQSFAPKLIASIDRAINFCNDTLRYGRAEEAAPRRLVFRLLDLVEEVGDGLGLPRQDIALTLDIDPGLQIDADREHLFRVLNNLLRNSAQAIEGRSVDGESVDGKIVVGAWRESRRVICEVRDNGPGIPEKARANLFRAFQGGARKGGSGLGLAIAAELVAAHGGRLEPIEGVDGATFRFDIADRTPNL